MLDHCCWSPPLFWRFICCQAPSEEDKVSPGGAGSGGIISQPPKALAAEGRWQLPLKKWQMLAPAFETQLLWSIRNFFALWGSLSVMNFEMPMKKISSTTRVQLHFSLPVLLLSWAAGGSSAPEVGGREGPGLPCRALCWGWVWRRYFGCGRSRGVASTRSWTSAAERI